MEAGDRLREAIAASRQTNVAEEEAERATETVWLRGKGERSEGRPAL